MFHIFFEMQQYKHISPEIQERCHRQVDLPEQGRYLP